MRPGRRAAGPPPHRVGSAMYGFIREIQTFLQNCCITNGKSMILKASASQGPLLVSTCCREKY